MEGNASAFREAYLDQGRECFIGTNVNNQSKSLCDTALIRKSIVLSLSSLVSFPWFSCQNRFHKKHANVITASRLVNTQDVGPTVLLSNEISIEDFFLSMIDISSNSDNYLMFARLWKPHLSECTTRVAN
jgi:hypothetical protein